MANYLGNAFSLGMLDCLVGHDCTVRTSLLTLGQAKGWVERHQPRSCVGHADTALLLSTLLETPVEMRRESTSLAVGDDLLVAQYTGPRLPEGATSLPEGARIRWILCHISMSVYVSIEGGALAYTDREPHDRESFRA